MHQANHMNRIKIILTQISYAIKQAEACNKEGLYNAEQSYLHDASDLSLELSRLTAIEWSKSANGETVIKK